jgi:hypothetical protein
MMNSHRFLNVVIAGVLLLPMMTTASLGDSELLTPIALSAACFILFALVGFLLRWVFLAGWAHRRNVWGVMLLGVMLLGVGLVAIAVTTGTFFQFPSSPKPEPTSLTEDPDASPAAETHFYMLQMLRSEVTSYQMTITPTADPTVMLVTETFRLDIPSAGFEKRIRITREVPTTDAGWFHREAIIQPFDTSGMIGLPTSIPPGDALPTVHLNDDSSILDVTFSDGTTEQVILCELTCLTVDVQLVLAKDAFNAANTSSEMTRSSFRGKETLRWTHTSFGTSIEPIAFNYYPGDWRHVPQAQNMLKDTFTVSGGPGLLLGLFWKRIRPFTFDPLIRKVKRIFRRTPPTPPLYDPKDV